MHKVTQEEASAHLGELIDEAARHGEPVVVMRGDVEVAKIFPVVTNTSARKAGSAKARGLTLWMADDFDAPLEEFSEYM